MAMLLMMGFSILSIACCIVMKISLKRANAKLREESEREGRAFVPYTL
jgi:hypothetical protein